MHIKRGLIVKEMDNEFILIDAGIEPPFFNGIIIINETGKRIIELLSKQDYSYEDLCVFLLDEYEVKLDELKKVIDPFLEELKRVKLLYE